MKNFLRQLGQSFRAWRRPNVWLLAIELALTWDTPAHALPVAIVAGVLEVSATSFAAIAVTAVINIALTYAVSALINAIVGTPKQQRQAQITTLAIGETPRAAIFGSAGVGGTLCDAFNWGGDYGTDWECLIIDLADHKCAGLQSFYVNDQLIYFPTGGFPDGYVPDQVVTNTEIVGGNTVTTTGTVHYNNQLRVWFLDGSTGQTLPDVVTNGGWTTTGNFAGITVAVVAYKADDPSSTTPVWSGGRPKFLWVVNGKLCYDPRKDTTVGGSGAHRWTDPTTWEWTDNAAICRYNWVRGIYAKDQVSDPASLLIGRGLTSLEAPEANVFAYANICDESVDLNAGGTEPRYRIGGVIQSNQTFVDIETMFADTMGGIIIQPGGSVEVEPGHARTPSFAITDDDLLVGAQVTVSHYRGEADNAWINTVCPRYTEPSQKWQEHGSPVRRALDTLTADGRPREQTLTLPLVTSGTQAQRLGEIQRRLGRLGTTVTITLGPRFSGIEEGDWGTWTSARHFSGTAVIFRVEAYKVDAKRQITLTMREIESEVYDWTPSTDEFISDVSAINQGAPSSAWTGYSAANGYRTDPLIANSAVSLSGLGYTGALNATYGAQTGSSLTSGSLGVLSDGQVVTNQGTAAAFTGQGALATSTLTPSQVANTNVAVAGANRIPFSLFEAGTGGWAFGQVSSGLTATSLVSGNYQNIPFGKIIATAPTTWSRQSMSIRCSNFAVNGGEQLAVTAGVETIGACTGEVVLWFVDSNGNGLGSAHVAWVPASTGYDTAVFGMIVAPAGAKLAWLEFYATANGSGYLAASIEHPMVCGVPTGQTTYPAFSPGPNAYNAADVTGNNTAAAIAGQGALATLNAVGTTNMAANAVSQVIAAYTSAGETLSQSGRAILQQATINAYGVGIIVNASVHLNGSSAMYQEPQASTTISLYRDGTLLWNCLAQVGATNPYDLSLIQTDEQITVSLMDAPFAGQHTYYLYADAGFWSGGILGSNRSISLMELKR